MEAVTNQAYRLKLPTKWRIYPMFYVLLLEKNVTRREIIDQKLANKLKFEKEEQPEQKVDLILDSIVFAKKTVDSKPPELYYLIH